MRRRADPVSAQVRAEAALLALVQESEQASQTMRADVDALLRHRRSVIEQLDAVVQDTRQVLEDLSAKLPISEAARARVLGAGRGLRRAATPPCPVDTFTVLDPLQTRLQDVTTALLNLTAARAVNGAR